MSFLKILLLLLKRFKSTRQIYPLFNTTIFSKVPILFLIKNCFWDNESVRICVFRKQISLSKKINGQQKLKNKQELISEILKKISN